MASEASKPLSQHQRNHQQKQHSPPVHREHEPSEESTKRIKTDQPLPEEVNLPPKAHDPNSHVASEFRGIAGSDDAKTVVRQVKGKHGVGKVDRRKFSWKKDVLVEKPTRLESPPDLNEVIFLQAVSTNAGITNNG